MTLHHPDLAWQWGEDTIIDRKAYTMRQLRGAEPPAPYGLYSRTAPTDAHQVKGYKQALAERVSYLIARAVGLPWPDTRWAVNVVDAGLFAVAIAANVTAIDVTQVERANGLATLARCGGQPVVAGGKAGHRGGKVITITNPSDYHGLRVLRAIANDLDGSKVRITPEGQIFGCDGASGWAWAWDALLRVPPDQHLVGHIPDAIIQAYEHEPEAIVTATLRRLTGEDIPEAIHAGLITCPHEAGQRGAELVAERFATLQRAVARLIR